MRRSSSGSAGRRSFAATTSGGEGGRRGALERVRGENTDGHGLLAALADLGVDLGGSALRGSAPRASSRGTRVVMVGAGGAAAGAVEALTRAGAIVRLLARRPEAARALKGRLPARQRARVTVAAWTPKTLADALRDATALVSAVPAAAGGAPARAGLR